MREHEIKPPAGSRRPKKRVGRGNGSGHGTYAGRGNKGQKARAGGTIPAWFEGGQMPLQRRVPKRGFNNTKFRIETQVVNLERFATVDETTFDRPKMAELGWIDIDAGPVKILAKGEIDRAVTVVADAFSAGARSAIEAAGGTATTIDEDR